jgi:hypothetical protein
MSRALLWNLLASLETRSSSRKHSSRLTSELISTEAISACVRAAQGTNMFRLSVIPRHTSKHEPHCLHRRYPLVARSPAGIWKRSSSRPMTSPLRNYKLLVYFRHFCYSQHYPNFLECSISNKKGGVRSYSNRKMNNHYFCHNCNTNLTTNT